MFIRAVAPISPGEEIAIPYIWPLKPSVLRRLMLEPGYNFTCKCPTCTLPARKLAESDSNRKRIFDFREVHERWKAGKASGKIVIMEGIELLRKGGIFDQEGLYGGHPRMEYWTLLFEVAAGHSSSV